MEINLIDKFKELPDVLINKIFDYTDIIVYRNGKYINRTKKNNSKYAILYCIPKPIKIGKNKVLLKLISFSHNIQGYLIEYVFDKEMIKMYIKFVIRVRDGFDRCYDICSSGLYIFNVNDGWSKLISYNM